MAMAERRFRNSEEKEALKPSPAHVTSTVRHGLWHILYDRR
jgi:hypothetical protein